MTFQQLGGPVFPLAEKIVQRREIASAGETQQDLRGAGRGAGAGVEQRDGLLTSRERLIEDGEVGNDDGEESEAQAGFDDAEGAAEGGGRGDVAVAEGEEGG